MERFLWHFITYSKFHKIKQVDVATFRGAHLGDFCGALSLTFYVHKIKQVNEAGLGKIFVMCYSLTLNFIRLSK